MDSGTAMKIIAATIPVDNNHTWVSAWTTAGGGRLRYDSVNDLNPSYSYPLTMLDTGAPAIYYVAGSSNGLYEASNNGQPIFVTYTGDIRIVNGVYNPTLVAFDDPGGGTLATQYYQPPPTGYGANRVNIGSQFGVTGKVYNVIFCHASMSTQAEMSDDVATPGYAEMNAELHDTSVPKETGFVYMGEKVMHVRQIIGRPYHAATYAMSRTGNGYLRIQKGLANIPDYPSQNHAPFVLLMACYNGWHGSTRMKYVINTVDGAAPTWVELRRNGPGALLTYDTSEDYSVTNPADLKRRNRDNTTFWGGTVITNPALANEIHAEFPYYYRFRFRSSRPTQFSSTRTATDSHTISIDTFPNTSPIVLEQIFQPGDDFSLFNWMGTPVLYPTS